MAECDDVAIDRSIGALAAADEELGDALDWSLRGAQPDALRPLSRRRRSFFCEESRWRRVLLRMRFDQRVETLETQRHVRAAFVSCEGVDFIDDHRSHAIQKLSAALGREE